MARIVMLVINPMTADSRVDKEATSLGTAGHQVTVVATHAPGLPDVEARDAYTVLRLPYKRVIKGRLERQEQEAARRSREARSALRVALQHAPHRLRTVGLVATYVHVVLVVLRRLRARAVWLAGGSVLKLARSRILPVEYWRGLASRIPDLVDRCDVIHAHDLGPLAAAVRLADHWEQSHPAQARPRVVYDSHEYYVEQNARWTPLEKRLWALHERRWIERADAVVTVSPGIARALQHRYGLPRRPNVIYNSPPLGQATQPGDVRSAAGLCASDHLIVYVGGVKPGRGVEHVVPALARLPGLHLAILGAGHSSDPHLAAILGAAEAARVGDRVHVLPSVPAAALPSFLATADAGVHPMEPSCLNHELALPNKLFDYVFAGLPVAVSDLTEMAAFVDEYGVGVTFDPRRPSSMATALEAVIEHAQRYRPSREVQARIRDRFGWPAQETTLHETYRRLLGPGQGSMA